MAEEVQGKWYVVYTTTNFEKKVKSSLEKAIKNRGLQEVIRKVEVPEEEKVEVKDGKKKVTTVKKFPGYVFINIDCTEEMWQDIWYLIRNTNGVRGFVSAKPTEPLEMTEADMIAMGFETAVATEVDYGVGDLVRVISGPFADSECRVEEMNDEKQQVRVSVSMFGRETPIYLDFTQVIKI